MYKFSTPAASNSILTENDQTQSKDWQTVLNKRQRSPEENATVKQAKLSDSWLSSPVQVSNRFDKLDDENSKPEERKTQDPKPSPIFVSGVKNINPLIELLNVIAKDNYIIKI